MKPNRKGTSPIQTFGKLVDRDRKMKIPECHLPDKENTIGLIKLCVLSISIRLVSAMVSIQPDSRVLIESEERTPRKSNHALIQSQGSHCSPIVAVYALFQNHSPPALALNQCGGCSLVGPT